MRTIFRLGVLCVFASALAWAESWTGKLLDATCAAKQTDAACTPTASTSSFAFQVGDKMYRFDPEGDKKAVQAFKESESGAERARNPNSPGDVTATVDGSIQGELIKLESIRVH